MRSLNYSANPFVPPPLKFPHNVMASAIGGDAGKVYVKNQPMESVADPRTTAFKISPKKIRMGQVPNRSEEAFLNEDFEALCLSIRLAQGNVIPIRVRRDALHPDGTEFTLVYGERRLRACQTEGVDVLAIIVNSEDASSEFMLMVRENLCRAGLSALELGRQASYAIENNLVPSYGRFALEVGSSKSRISEAVRLARLPEEVLSAFPVPRDLQFRDAKPLTDAVQANLPAVLAEIQKIKAEGDAPSTKAVVSRLVEASGTAVRRSNDAHETVLKFCGERFGHMRFDNAGKVEIEFDQGFAEKYRPALEKHLVDFYKKKILRIGLKARLDA